MKRTILFIIGLLLGLGVMAQAPQAFRYQAVARDKSGNVLARQSVSFRITIKSGSAQGTEVYGETHSGLNTNAYVLVELMIGRGTPTLNDFRGSVGFSSTEGHLYLYNGGNASDGYKGVNYAEMSAVLVEAIKAQQALIETIKSENSRLKTDMEALKSTTERRLSVLEELLKTAGK